MLEWVLARTGTPTPPHQTDKLNRRDAQRVLRDTTAACSDTSVTVQLFSAHEKEGLEEARQVMDRWLHPLKKARGYFEAAPRQPTRHGMTNRSSRSGEERGRLSRSLG